MLLKKIFSSNWKQYKRIWSFFGNKHLKWMLLGIFCTVIAASMEGYTITLVKNIVDNAFIEKNMQSVYLVGLQIILAFTIKGIFNYSKDLSMSKAGIEANFVIQKKVYKHALYMDINKFYDDGTGKILNYFFVQSSAVLNLLTSNLSSFVQSFVTLLVALFLMVWYAPQMCLILIFLGPAIILPMFFIMKKIRKSVSNVYTTGNKLAEHLIQSFQGIKTIQSFNSQNFELNRFKKVLNDYFASNYKVVQATSIQSPVLEFMISIGLCFALIMGGYFIVQGNLSTGGFTAFLLALTSAYKPAKSLAGVGNTIQQGLIAAEIIFEFLDSVSDIKEKKNAKVLNDNNMFIEYKDITFAYNGKEPVLKNVSLSVPSGKMCALVGASGGGKTTLFNLLERFYEPQTGSILINGIDVRDYTLESLRNNISEVSQDVFLFNSSIYDNIKYNIESATKEDVEKAAKVANAHDFIMGLPNGYDTFVGENGVMLSGGQKQRIAIARAILKNSPILLLDEATSALDTESERFIQSAIKKISKGKTTFVIAHRLSTIFDADIIYVIGDGKIIESGSHEELVKLNGYYKKLLDSQVSK